MHSWKEKTLHKHNLRFNKYVLPIVGDKVFEEVKIDDLESILDIVQKKGVLNVRDKIFITLKNLYDWAMAKKYEDGKTYTDLNYAAMVPKVLFFPKKSQNYRHITTESEFEGLVKQVYSVSAKPEVKACLIMALHLFTRPSEITNLRWDQINFESREIHFSAEQMKMERPFMIPISEQVYLMLQDLQKISGYSDYVFLSTYKQYDRKPITSNTLNNALRRNNVKESTTHGFRHCASTLLREKLNYEDPEIEAQLSHVIGGVKGVYNKAEYLDKRAEMMQAWSNFIEEKLAS
jgi:integrase